MAALVCVTLVALLLPDPGVMGQVPFDEVLGNLKSPDASVRLAALRQLREAAYPEAIAPVASLFTDPDRRVQAEAIETELAFFVARPVPTKRRAGIIVEIRGPKGAEAAFQADPEVMLPRAVPAGLSEGLLAALQRTEPSVQVQVLYMMGTILRPPVAQAIAVELMGLIDRGGPAERRAAARVAGRLRVQESGEALIYKLNDPDVGVRIGAMEALGWLREARAVDALAALVEYHGHKGEGMAALETLARIGHPSSARLFTARLADRNVEVRRMAAEGLGRAGIAAQLSLLEAGLSAERSALVRLALAFAAHRLGRPSLPALVEALSQKDRRRQARGYLAELAPDILGPLQDYLRSPDAGTRAAVASVLGVIGDASTMASLEALASDPDDDVRTIAADAVRRLRLVR